jgi:hypothetical protein
MVQAMGGKDWSSVLSDRKAALMYHLSGIWYIIPFGLLLASCIISNGWKNDKMGSVGADALRYVPASLSLLLVLFAMPLMLGICIGYSRVAACRHQRSSGCGGPVAKKVPLQYFLIFTRGMGLATNLSVATIVGGNFSSYLPNERLYWKFIALTILTFVACDALWQLGGINLNGDPPEHDKNRTGLENGW